MRAPRSSTAASCTRVDCVSLGIVVNEKAQRFYDEGEDFWPKRYAIWGRLVAQQPGQIGYSIIDAKSMGKFMPPVFPPFKAQSIARARARTRNSTRRHSRRRWRNSTRRCARGPSITRCSTIARREGLVPPKTHWARAIDTPPFFAYPLRPGITFTYLGVTVNERAQVILRDERPASNIFAAGEIMAGNMLGKGYIAGIGMAIGTTFGRIAGQEAARHVAA